MSFFQMSSGYTNLNTLYNSVEVWDITSNPPYNHMDVVDGTLHIHDDILLAVECVEENGSVSVHSGTYTVSRTGLIVDKPLQLVGENNKTTIVKSDSTAPYVFCIQSKGVEIRNFNITGALTSHESQSTQAGIRISLKYNLHYPKIIISNNIITKNRNGLFSEWATTPSSGISVLICNNTIFKNMKDGVIFTGVSSQISHNTIYNHIESGIDLWGADNCRIEYNNIFNNNLDGIWIDSPSIDNIVFSNLITMNKRNGITFFNAEFPLASGYCENNQIENNIIISNEQCGLYLYHAKNNDIINNTIENNKQAGLFISTYRNFSLYLKEEHPTSTGNVIHHNNFINNGRDGKKNAVDTWSLSNNQYTGNYWSDYMDRYKKDSFIEDDVDKRDSTWSQQYKIPLYFFGLRLNFISTNYDTKPYCRINGWGPRREPETPKIEPTDCVYTATINTPFWVSVCASDPNRDQLQYCIDWGDGIISTSWQDGSAKVWSNPFNSTSVVNGNHYWTNTGTYQVKVQAKDYCPIDKKSDGFSIWSEPLNITVMN